MVLAVRLLANMFAGHLVLAVIVGFIAATATFVLLLVGRDAGQRAGRGGLEALGVVRGVSCKPTFSRFCRPCLSAWRFISTRAGSAGVPKKPFSRGEEFREQVRQDCRVGARCVVLVAFAGAGAREGRPSRRGKPRCGGCRPVSCAGRRRSGPGLVILGAGYGIGKIGASAVESMARQPEVAGNIQTAMIIAAALIEGVTFFALIVCMMSAPSRTALRIARRIMVIHDDCASVAWCLSCRSAPAVVRPDAVRRGAARNRPCRRRGSIRTCSRISRRSGPLDGRGLLSCLLADPVEVRLEADRRGPRQAREADRRPDRRGRSGQREGQATPGRLPAEAGRRAGRGPRHPRAGPPRRRETRPGIDRQGQGGRASRSAAGGAADRRGHGRRPQGTGRRSATLAVELAGKIVRAKLNPQRPRPVDREAVAGFAGGSMKRTERLSQTRLWLNPATSPPQTPAPRPNRGRRRRRADRRRLRQGPVGARRAGRPDRAGAGRVRRPGGPRCFGPAFPLEAVLSFARWSRTEEKSGILDRVFGGRVSPLVAELSEGRCPARPVGLSAGHPPPGSPPVRQAADRVPVRLTHRRRRWTPAALARSRRASGPCWAASRSWTGGRSRADRRGRPSHRRHRVRRLDRQPIADPPSTDDRQECP